MSGGGDKKETRGGKGGSVGGLVIFLLLCGFGLLLAGLIFFLPFIFMAAH
jgi:hypothetical protein